ncbi:MAG: hypothetical protein IPL67_18720 [Ignavibacteria bacterium]|nr:hypothetical protein [Ignavibacteria bacterium]
MINTSLIAALRTFSKDELKRFEEFLLSPFFNKKKPVIKLFQSIKKFAPEFNSPRLERKKVWEALFKGKDFNYGVMKNLIYELGKLADKFLSISHLEKDTLAFSVNLMREQLMRGLSQSFEKNLRTAREDIALNGIDLHFYHNSLSLDILDEYYQSQEFNSQHFKGEGTLNVVRSLTLHYFTSLTERYYNHLLVCQYSSRKFEGESMDIFLDYLSKCRKGNEDIVDLCGCYIKTVLEPFNEDNYSEYKVIIQKMHPSLSKYYLNKLYIAKINFCNNLVMIGKAGYNKELFEVLKTFVYDGIYAGNKNETLNQYNYAMAVSCACNEGEFDWAEKFIEEFKNKLRLEFRDQYYLYARITLCMKKKDYENALGLLTGVKQINFMDKITVKRYQLMIYFESGYSDELFSMLDTFSSFKNKNKELSDQTRELIGNFIYFMKKLAELKFGENNIGDNSFLTDKLSHELEIKKVVNKIWFREKLEEMKVAN